MVPVVGLEKDMGMERKFNYAFSKFAITDFIFQPWLKSLDL